MNDQGDLEVLLDQMKFQQKLATQNAKTAAEAVDRLNAEVREKLAMMQTNLVLLSNQVASLQTKYNLLLSERFDGRSTTEQ